MLEQLETRALLTCGLSEPVTDDGADTGANDVPLGAVQVPLVEDSQAEGLRFGCATGKIDPGAAEQDYWKFEAQAGERVSIRVDTPNPGSALDPSVFVYDTEDHDPDGWIEADGNDGPGNDAFISSWEIPGDGTYYIKVDTASFTSTPGTYVLQLDVVGDIQLENDAEYWNDTLSNQINLESDGSEATGAIAGVIMGLQKGEPDDDHFKLGTIEEGLALELTVALPESSTLVPRIVVKGPDGVLADDDPHDAHFRAAVPTTGAYSVELSGYWTTNESRYLPLVHNPSPFTYDAKMEWDDADLLAQEKGGHLPQVEDAAEDVWLDQNFGAAGSVWLGLEYGDSGWAWSNGNALAAGDHMNWAPGDPPADSAGYNVTLSDYTGPLHWYAVNDTKGRIAVAEFPGTGDPADQQPGSWARYVLQVEVTDIQPPAIEDVDEFPDGGVTSEVISSFTVTTSEVLNAATVNELTHWELLAADDDGKFGTGGDEAYNLEISPAYVDGTSIEFSVTNGPLAEGLYRFTAKESLEDLAENALDGDGDGAAGGDFTRTFTVDFSDRYIFEGRANDTQADATGLPLTESPAGSGSYQGFGMGSIDPSADKDWWSIEAEAGDRLAIAVDPQEGLLQPEIVIHDPAGGSVIVSGSDEGGPGSAAYVSHYEVSSSGTYHIETRLKAGSPDKYKLRVELARGIDLETDAGYHNNANADDLTFTPFGGTSSATVAGTIMASELSGTTYTHDVDRFALGELGPGNTVELQVQLPFGSTLVPYLRVIDGDGNLLSDTDGNLTDAQFQAAIPAVGNYYAEVLGYWIWNGHRYVTTRGAMNSAQAEAFAVELGGHLATITSEEENSWVDGALLDRSLWLGLHDAKPDLHEPDDRLWVWTSGETLTETGYDHWKGPLYVGGPSEPKQHDASNDRDGVVMSPVNGGPDWYAIDKDELRYGLVETPGMAEDAVDGAPGAMSQYVLQVAVSDTSPPKVEDVSQIPEEGGATSDAFRQFHVMASKTLNPATVSDTDTWELIAAGADGSFDTTDDVAYALSASLVGGDSTVAELTIDGAPLAEGHYRFSIAPILTDRFGNPLDGNGDGSGGDAYVHKFYVDYTDAQVLEGSDNDSQATATALDLREDPWGSGYMQAFGMGALDPTTDQDWWYVSAKEGDQLAIALDPESDGLVAAIDLFKETGEHIVGDSDGDGPEQAAYISHYDVPADGDYYIRVSYLSGTPDLYQLRVEAGRQIDLESDEDYANNTLAGADPITMTAQGDTMVGAVGGTIMGSESGNPDIDVYSLGTIHAGDSAVVKLRLPQGSSLNPHVKILDEDETVVSENFLQTRANITATGTYYAAVSTWSGVGAGPQGQYVMDAHVQSTDDWVETPDLIVTGITAPSTARGGQTISISWTVTNNGDKDAHYWSDQVVLSLDRVLDDGDYEVLPFSFQTDLLPVGESYTGTANVKLPYLDAATEYSVFVTTDALDDIAEGDFEDNNTSLSPSTLVVLEPMRILDLIDILPDPRNAPLDEFEVVFSEPIDTATLTNDALTLHRNDYLVPIPDDVSLTVTAVSETHYRVSGLGSLTGVDGDYELKVDAEEILIPAGVPGLGRVSDKWLMDAMPPTSRVDALPDIASSLAFEIGIGGVDIPATPNATTSGLDFFEIYVSVNQAPFAYWDSVPAGSPSVMFEAQSNTLYAFRSVAVDLAGNREAEETNVDARTIVPDLSNPETKATFVDTTTATFQVEVQGTDSGSGLDFIDVFVRVDDSVTHHFGTIPAGEQDSSGFYHGSIQYQAIADGLMHKYCFYTVGQDIVENREEVPGGDLDFVAVASYSVLNTLEISNFDVQQTASQRSFVRYLDVLFSDDEGLDDLVQSLGVPGDERIRLLNLGIDGSDEGVEIDLEGVIHVIGQELTFDFGAEGIGKDRDSATGNGYYELGFDLNEDGKFTGGEVLHFYRLFGDTNGDRLIDTIDYMAVRRAYRQSGTNLDEDIDGSGLVDFWDIRHVRGQLGKSIPTALETDD